MPAVDSAMRDWVEDDLLAKHGTDNQRERWERDLLPEDELLQLARNVLFAPFADFRRWQKLQSYDVKHEKGCSSSSHIAFSTRHPEDLSAEEWAMFKRLQAVLNDRTRALFTLHKASVTIDLVEHVGACSRCAAETYGRAASVRIEWAGRPLSREYSLEAT